jgi:hypothetical protein
MTPQPCLFRRKSIRGQADIDVRERLRVSVSASTARQERTARDPLWQTTASAGLAVRF